jgi:hypothetical protein
MTDAESIAYLRSWISLGAWHPDMIEAINTVCDLADKAALSNEEAEKLEWLLDKSIGRSVQFLERFLPQGRTFIPRARFESIMQRGRYYHG